MLGHDEDGSNCTCYVFRSCSDYPIIQTNPDAVFKFVITNGNIDEITKNAKHKPDWLLAGVEQVAAFLFKNVSATQLREDLFAILEPEVCDISITDGDGQTAKPLGWYGTTITEIEEAVETFRSEQEDSTDWEAWMDEFEQDEGKGAFGSSTDMSKMGFSNIDVGDFQTAFGKSRKHLADENHQGIDLDDYEYGSLQYRIAEFRLWLLPKSVWAKILIWITAIVGVCLLIAVAASLAVIAFYLVAGIAVLAVMGWMAGLQKK